MSVFAIASVTTVIIFYKRVRISVIQLCDGEKLELLSLFVAYCYIVQYTRVFYCTVCIKRQKKTELVAVFLQNGSHLICSLVYCFDSSLFLKCLCQCSLVLKTGSDKIIYWLGRYSFFLGFIMSKNPKGLWFSILIKISVCNLSRLKVWFIFGFFDIIKPRRKEYLPSQ